MAGSACSESNGFLSDSPIWQAEFLHKILSILLLMIHALLKEACTLLGCCTFFLKPALKLAVKSSVQELQSLKSKKELDFVCFGRIVFEWRWTVPVVPIIVPLSWAFPVFLWELVVRLVNSISGHVYPGHKSVWYVTFEWIKTTYNQPPNEAHSANEKTLNLCGFPLLPIISS